MERNLQGYLVSETHRQCTNCLCIFEKKNNTVVLCASCNTNRVKSQSAEMKMYRRAKRRALERDLEFGITPDDIEIPRVCPILGIPIYSTKGRSGAFDNSPSLDRYNPDVGYTKENVWVISQLANAMKSSASEEQLKNFANWVIKTY